MAQKKSHEKMNRMIPENNYQHRREVLKHNSAQMNEMASSPLRRQKIIKEKHDWNEINLKERWQKNCVHYHHHRFMQIYDASHKVSATKEADNKRQRAEQQPAGTEQSLRDTNHSSSELQLGK